MDSHGVSMHNLDLTAAWFRLLYRCLSRSTALAILAFTTLGAIVTCIALVTHWLSVFIIARKWHPERVVYVRIVGLVSFPDTSLYTFCKKHCVMLSGNETKAMVRGPTFTLQLQVITESG